jgi:enoyl-CoA hydratase/carnithine racemase
MLGDMSQTLEESFDGGLATVRLNRCHGNAINLDLVDELTATFRRLDLDDKVRGVQLAATGKLFSPGLDLQELIELGRTDMERFLERFNACILSLYTFSKPLLAAIHGHAVAGGCVLTLTADWRVLQQEKMIGLNEIRVGVPFPYGVAMILRESVPQRHLQEVALFGRNYRGEEAVQVGLVHEVHAAEGFEGHCSARLDALASKDAAAFAITKRYLRATTVERIMADEARLESDFLDRWFSSTTRSKIQAIVDELRG